MDAHCETDPGQRCITCSDEGVVMRVLDLDMGTGVAVCADGLGAKQNVAVDLVGPLAPGDEILVHAGVALTTLSSSEARA
jgi:hydrogenase maturation factor